MTKIEPGTEVIVRGEGHALVPGAKGRVVALFSDGVARLAVPDLGGGMAHVPTGALEGIPKGSHVWHVVTNADGRILAVYGAALVADARDRAERIARETGCATNLHHLILAKRPRVGDGCHRDKVG